MSTQQVFSPSKGMLQRAEDYFAIDQDKTSFKKILNFTAKTLIETAITITALVETFFFAALTGSFSLFYLFSPEHFEPLKQRTIVAAQAFKDSVRALSSLPMNKKIEFQPEIQHEPPKAKAIPFPEKETPPQEPLTPPSTVDTHPKEPLNTEIAPEEPKIEPISNWQKAAVITSSYWAIASQKLASFKSYSKKILKPALLLSGALLMGTVTYYYGPAAKVFCLNSLRKLHENLSHASGEAYKRVEDHTSYAMNKLCEGIDRVTSYSYDTVKGWLPDFTNISK